VHPVAHPQHGKDGDFDIEVWREFAIPDVLEKNSLPTLLIAFGLFTQGPPQGIEGLQVYGERLSELISGGRFRHDEVFELGVKRVNRLFHNLP
jgi:hypothetical protein